MIKLAKDLISNILRNHGVKQISFTEEGFERIKIYPSAIILAEKEKLVENRRKVCKWTDEQTGKRYLRWQIYDRLLPISVNLFHQTEEKVDELLILPLLSDLPKGMDDGKRNYVSIVPAGIEWPPEQKERALAVVFIQFVTGVYDDVPIDTFNDINVNLTV